MSPGTLTPETETADPTQLGVQETRPCVSMAENGGNTASVQVAAFPQDLLFAEVNLPIFPAQFLPPVWPRATQNARGPRSDRFP